MTEILSIVALLVSLASLAVTYFSFRFQRDPQVVVRAVQDADQPSIMHLIIENTGGSTAENIRFSSNQPIPKEAFGIEKAAGEVRHFDKGPLIHGIPSLTPGERRTLLWGQFGGIKKGLGGESLEIKASFQAPFWLNRSKEYLTTSAIDIESFRGAGYVTSPEVEQLKNINASLKAIEVAMRLRSP